ncbi:MAG TPA: hypothetical protein VNS09_00810 [Solirubrobacter sp.]|nr:hypothetical protein [Solirubrobacter sp.]
MSAVFLSASFPQPERAAAFPPSDPAALADAVTAVARGVLGRDAQLVSCGHPTITPLLLYVAAEFGWRERLVVYQSERFRAVVPEETWRLGREGYGDLRFTPSVGALADDLERMRREALTSADYRGAVFIGGMEGIVDEYELFGELHPHAHRFALAGPGGAAAQLPDHTGSRRYPVVALEIVRALGL